MGKETKIAWCHHTFNSSRGCAKVSDGCKHCYAEDNSGRNPGVFGVWGLDGSRVVPVDATWGEPVAWDRDAEQARERRRVFCASVADVFEDWQGPVVDAKGNPLCYTLGSGVLWHPDLGGFSDPVPVTYDDVRDRLHALIALTPSLDWLLLTKRPEVAARYYAAPDLYQRVLAHADGYWRKRFPRLGSVPVSDPVKQFNRWNGVSVESQDFVSRIDLLKEVPAAVRFVSCEPLLGRVDYSDVLGLTRDGDHWARRADLWRTGWTPPVDWVITGGESGRKARPCDINWHRLIRDQCAAAGVACFVKQLGKRVIGSWGPGGTGYGPVGPFPGYSPAPLDGGFWKLLDPKGGDESEWPPDLRVRQFPEPVVPGFPYAAFT